MARKNIVIDASIITKWFNSEEHTDKALSIRDSYIKGKIVVEAPMLAVYEVANALRYNPDFGDADISKAVTSIMDMLKLRRPERALMDIAIRYAYQYGITVYDASYVALAEKLDTMLITGDKKLSKKGIDRVAFIGGFPLGIPL